MPYFEKILFADYTIEGFSKARVLVRVRVVTRTRTRTIKMTKTVSASNNLRVRVRVATLTFNYKSRLLQHDRTWYNSDQPNSSYVDLDI